MKQKVTVTSAALVTTKLLFFNMCDCAVDANVGTGDLSLVLSILHLC